MKISDFNSWLQRDVSKSALILIYGPDLGLVHERAGAIAHKAVDNPEDPFQLVRLDGDEVAGDPLRLVDEANTIGMFGGRRVIWLRVGAKQIMAALAPLLSNPPQDAIVILEAGDLKKSAPLRTACEKSPACAVIPCYAEDTRSLAALAREILQAADLKISSELLQTLVAELGADRAASRGEIEKLALYCHGQGEVSGADLDAVISDVAALESSSLVDAAFMGDFGIIENRSMRLFAEGLEPGVLLNSALRHALTLKKLLQHGLTNAQAMSQMATAAGIFFKRHGLVEQQLRSWSSERVDRAIAQLADAVAQIRKTPRLGEAIAGRALWTLALAARRR